MTCSKGIEICKNMMGIVVLCSLFVLLKHQKIKKKLKIDFSDFVNCDFSLQLKDDWRKFTSEPAESPILKSNIYCNMFTDCGKILVLLLLILLS